MILHDKKSGFRAKIDDTTGFLTAPVTLARTGVQEYFGFELGLNDEKYKKFGVLRKPEEVFSDESIKSFTNLVVTDDHPQDLVNIDNIKKLQNGTVSGVNVNDDQTALAGVVTVTDKDLINKIKSGKVEVSVGYTNELKREKGQYNGKDYDFTQTNIIANHLAIVDAGRCGAACKITTDKQKGLKMKIVIIDSINYEVENDQLAQAIVNQQKAWDKKKEEMEEDKKKSDEEKEESEETKDKLQAQVDSLKAEKVNDSDLEKLIQDRAILISDAKIVLGDSLTECGNCPKEIRSAVVAKLNPEVSLDGKTSTYIEAAYDIAMEKFKKSKKSLDNLQGDFETKDKLETTRDTARNKYAEGLGLAV